MAGESFHGDTPLFAIHEKSDEGELVVRFVIPSDVTKYLASAAQLFQINNLTSHSLKRGFWSVMSSSGVSEPVAHALGRTSYGTAGRYITISPESLIFYMRKAYVWSDNALERLLNGLKVYRSEY